MTQRRKVKRLRPVGKAAGAVTSLALLSVPFSAQAEAEPKNQLRQPHSSAARMSRPSVVGLWHLDERKGRTVHDSSGNANHGVISGSVEVGVAGRINTAYRFVPKGAVIVLGARELVPGSARIRISYWLKLATPPVLDYDIFVKGDSLSRGGQIKLEVQATGQASCMFRGSLGEKQLEAGPNVINGRWHKVICQRIGNQIIQIVDGTAYSVTKPIGAITVTDPVRLGSHRRKGDWYQGVLDEVRYAIG